MAKLVATNGCFDLLHIWHIRLLEFAKSQGTELLVLINSDFSVASLKGDGRPIMPDEERAEVLRALECVDSVLIFQDEYDLARLYAHFKPEVMVKDSYYRNREITGSVFAKEVVFFEPTGHSTSEIIRRVKDGRRANL